ncbi:hypothetical protein B1H18_34865, partial [Streptomyces tsukubensis]
MRDVVLVSRGGAAAVGAVELREELVGLGAGVRVVACDVGDRASVVELLEGVCREGRLTGVVHAAGVLDDGVLESLSVERVERVLRPKVDGAVFLHELTLGMDLSAFVLFSSVAGVLGNAGQGNYAAANAFLDALAQRRRAGGLPGVSLAWGLWGRRGGLTGGLGAVDVARLGRSGILPMGTGEALGLFDVALGGERALVVPVRFDRAAASAGVG